MAWLLGLALLPFLLTAPAHADDGFLEPSVAFAFQAHEVPGAVALQYRVAEGYYMYRERFAFSSPDAGVRLGAPRLPAGQVKFDETFGKEVETYRHEVAITVPVEHADGPFDLVVTSQGCSDKGVCYPPITHHVQVAGAALSAATSSSASSASSARVRRTARRRGPRRPSVCRRRKRAARRPPSMRSPIPPRASTGSTARITPPRC